MTFGDGAEAHILHPSLTPFGKNPPMSLTTTSEAPSPAFSQPPASEVWVFPWILSRFSRFESLE